MAGNMVDYDGVSRTYNAANQMTNDGTNTLTYDNNGNLTGNGSDTYTWDSANRLLSVGNHSYVYDGLGNRVQQTVSGVVTDYLNDVQPGLTKLLKQDDGTNVERFVHAPRGIHAVDDGTNCNFYLQDGLGSVRAVVDANAAVQTSMSYDPYGSPMAAYGAGFGFTGEQTDENSSVFLRARYYEPGLGIFAALDPFEGVQNRPMSLNGYSWVEGNVSNMTDPSGEEPATLAVLGFLALVAAMGLSAGYVATQPARSNSSVFGGASFSLGNFWEDTCLPFFESLHQRHPFRMGLPELSAQLPISNATTTGTLNSGDLDIPIPDNCLNNPTIECQAYLRRLLEGLQDLAAATAIASTILNAEFSIYVDGGRVVPSGISFSGEGVLNQTYNDTMAPYQIRSRSTNRIIARPPSRTMNPLPGQGDPSRTYFSGRAASHFYAEFRLGIIGRVYDNHYRLGGPSISNFHSDLAGVEWRNCRKYRGLTFDNFKKAISVLGQLHTQATYGFERVSSLNRLGRSCPMG